MKSIGKYGEYRVLANLLELDIEAYQAINLNQPDFDITAILDSGKVVRIQVKSTELHNQATNNPIDRIDKEYHFLVVVIFEGQGIARFFVLSKEEAIMEKGTNKQLGVTQQRKKVSQVKDCLIQYEDQWNKIVNA
ncbi:hypothetical protein D6089_21340 [Vibrio vulnificus]|uniref:hypothetical protein n=1 Tax=Vibrio vulnificus TaxID=672 RepID=UPI002935B84E|nr:hypothetical protein [Vibrio vulnificus]ELQ2527058.1 hypothetical protein [Vibrio vulnificus]